MALVLWVTGVLIGVFVVRDLLYRWLVIRPMTDLSGRYAAYIEHDHNYRWVVPVLADHKNPVDVHFAGNSHVIDGIDPGIVSRESGWACYNLALYSLPAQNAVGLLDLFGNYPRLLFIDFSTRYSAYRHEEGVTQQALAAASMPRSQRARQELADRIQWLAPSLFVPRPFRPVFLRSFQKLQHFRTTGRMAIGRYTPFRPFVSYDWWFDKTSNHRLARRVRPRSRWEQQREEHLIDLRLSETQQLCDPESAAYRESLLSTYEMVERLIKRGVKVVFMRLPMHPRVVTFEDAHFAQFFADVRALAASLRVEYLDLTAAEHAEAIGPLDFYSDGHHVCHPSDVRLSMHMAKLVRDRLPRDANASEAEVAQPE